MGDASGRSGISGHPLLLSIIAGVFLIIGSAMEPVASYVIEKFKEPAPRPGESADELSYKLYEARKMIHQLQVDKSDQQNQIWNLTRAKQELEKALREKPNE